MSKSINAVDLNTHLGKGDEHPLFEGSMACSQMGKRQCAPCSRAHETLRVISHWRTAGVVSAE
jgi:elongation factor P hydroxylase